LKILSASQIRDWDNFTIQKEPITSIDLMERASLTFVNWLEKKFSDTSIPIYIFCGQGNNGGDGLAIARLLSERAYDVEVYVCKIGNSSSEDFSTNLKRLPPFQKIKFYEIEKEDNFPQLESKGILIDAIFGSGLNRPIEGYWEKLIRFLNEQNQIVVSVDIPSGVFADAATEGISIFADYTFSFQVPKLAFFFSENEQRVGEWLTESINLHQGFLEATDTPFFYLEKKYVQSILKPRRKFSHKGTYGHALIIAGSYGKMGAAVLATKAALRSGAGLVTCHIPKVGYDILQISTPEAMASIDISKQYFSVINDLEKYNAIAIGPGLGMEAITKQGVEDFFNKIKTPIVVDADALNLIAQNNWLEKLPSNSILTPHPKEFERLFGKTQNSFERMALQRIYSKKHQIYIILKGAHTCISTPSGECYFNSTGNPGMATGGSGDVLTGILVSLLAQGYSSLETCQLGVYLHGLAGDLASLKIGSEEGLIASDVVSALAESIKKLK